MFIGSAPHIVKTPPPSAACLRTHPGASAQTAGTKKPAEHPVWGLKPVHQL